MAKNAAKLRGAKKRLEELATNFDVRKLAARIEEGDNKEDYYILCGWMGEDDVNKFLAESKNDDKVFVVVEEDKEKFFGEPRRSLRIQDSSSHSRCSYGCTGFRQMMRWIRRCSWH